MGNTVSQWNASYRPNRKNREAQAAVDDFSAALKKRRSGVTLGDEWGGD
jgi:hypothetical protein